VFQVLYVTRPNRLSRRTEHVFDIISQLQAAGVRVVVDGREADMPLFEEMKPVFESLKKMIRPAKQLRRTSPVRFSSI